MPIEIRELIIEDSLARTEDRGNSSEQLLTSSDKEIIKEEVIAEIRSGGTLKAEERRELIEEILSEVRKILDDRWRR